MPSVTPDPARRSEQSRRAILDAVLTLVGELGYEHVSIEAIAHQAGVGKQTIYRWWSSKGAVVLEALDSSLTTVAGFPDTGDVVADLRTQMQGVTQMLASEIGPLYRGLIAAAQSDAALAQAHLTQVIEPASVACRQRLARAKDRGELREDADIQTIIDLLYGAIYYRMLLHTRPLNAEQVDIALDIIFKGVR